MNIFNWLYKRHKHSFTAWEVIKRLGNSSADYVIIQQRQCTTCGLTQIKKQVI